MFKLFKYDISIQIRSGFWTVYTVIGIVYILILVNLPVDIRDDVAVYLIYSDTSVLGLIFVGALVLLEKQQGVLQSMSVTPLKLNKYIFSKVLSLTILSIIISSAVWIIPQKSLHGYVLLLPPLIFSSFINTMFGIGFASGVSTFNQFIARVLLGSLIFIVPVIPMLVLKGTGWLIIFPMNATIDMFIRITEGSFSDIQLIDMLILLFWSVMVTLFSRRQFQKHNFFI